MTTGRLAGCLLAAVCVSAGTLQAAAAAEPAFFGKAVVGAAVGPVQFTTTSGPVLLEGGPEKWQISCSASTGAGEVTGPVTISSYVMRLYGCEIVGLGMSCRNGNEGSGRITTEPLTGELGAITTTLPGIRLRAQNGRPLADFNCQKERYESRNWLQQSVIATLSGAAGESVAEGKLASSLKLSLSQAHGVQRYTHFLAGASEQLALSNEWWVYEGQHYEGISTEAPIGLATILTLTSNPRGALGATR